MTATRDDRPGEGAEEGLEEAVRRRERQVERGRVEGERPIWRNMSMIGSLGWLIVTPTLLGVLAGRWLDRMFDSGVFFSGALIFLGVSLGFRLAWSRMHKE